MFEGQAACAHDKPMVRTMRTCWIDASFRCSSPRSDTRLGIPSRGSPASPRFLHDLLGVVPADKHAGGAIDLVPALPVQGLPTVLQVTPQLTDSVQQTCNCNIRI